MRVEPGVPAFGSVAIRTTRVSFFAVEKRAHRFTRRQLFDGRAVTLDLGICGAWRESDLFSEDVEDAGETNKRRVFSDRAGRKFAEIWYYGFHVNYTSSSSASRSPVSV